ncbi:TPA: DUF1542 domain-containing protein [Streptococcus pyogenes]|nr:DUF1542 domain-containing protein [Streptococcus pyogenes]HER7294599.1 DUF1542 domain-containing protein [Streptococcus pyogenes]HER8189617.1 DUF1542 domain-containing protein [Streptococcus pyogenes]HER8304917.1 DUF1542 domain-containing protein [Streptococcus pyogenes]HER8596619.1 DUF1542 domain-containing protein [Streptococcus pyogenes]
MFLKHQDVKQKKWRMRKVKKVFVSSCMLLTVGLGVAVPTGFSQSNGVMVVKAAEMPATESKSQELRGTPANEINYEGTWEINKSGATGRYYSESVKANDFRFYYVKSGTTAKKTWLPHYEEKNYLYVRNDTYIKINNQDIQLNYKKSKHTTKTVGFKVNSQKLKQDHDYELTFKQEVANGILTSYRLGEAFSGIKGYNTSEESKVADNIVREFNNKEISKDYSNNKNGDYKLTFTSKVDNAISLALLTSIESSPQTDMSATFSNFKLIDKTPASVFKNGTAIENTDTVKITVIPGGHRKSGKGDIVTLRKEGEVIGSGSVGADNIASIKIESKFLPLKFGDKLFVETFQPNSKKLSKGSYVEVQRNPQEVEKEQKQRKVSMQQLEEARNRALEKIGQNKWIDSNEITQEQTKVNEEYKLGVQALEKAHGDQILTLATQYSVKITNSASDPDTKKEEKLQKSKEKIRQKLSEEQHKLSEDNTLFQKDKDLKDKELKEQAATADKSLQSANSLEELKKKEQAGVDSIKYESGTSIPEQKDKAITSLNEAYTVIENKIESDSGLSRGEKEEQKKLAKEKLDESIKKIQSDDVKDADKIQEELNAGKNAINGEYKEANPKIEQQKHDFEKELEKIRNSELKEIEADNSLTTPEKKNKQQEVEKNLTDAKLILKDIDNREDLDKEREKLQNKIRDTHKPGNIEDVQNTKIEDLRKIYTAKTNDIAKDSWLTKEQKTEQKNKAKEAFDNAEKNIKELTTADDIVQATSKHKGEIEASHTKGVKEDVLKAAIDEIDEKLNEVKEQIQKDPTVSREDKEAKVKEATDKANIAKEEIAKQSNADDVKKVTSEEKPKVTYTKGTLLKDQLEKALKELEEQKEATDKEISEDSTLSAEQKATQKQETQKRLDEAKAKLQLLKPDVEGDNALTADNINAIVKEGKPSIQKEYKKDDKTFEEHKKDFEAEVEKAKQAELDEISNDKSMTTPEKEIAKAKVEEKAAEVLKSIDGVTSREMLDKKRPMISEIRDIHTNGNIDTVKDNAKAELQKVHDETVAKINGDDTLDKATKEAQVKEADKALAAGKEAITKADDADKVSTAVTEHTPKIKAAHKTGDLKKVQEEANQALDKAAEKEREEINKDATLTTEDKAKQLKEVETALTKAKDNVKAAKTADAINDARDKGVATIDAVHKAGQDLGARKSGQVAKLEEAAKATKDKISADPTLTSKEKEEQSKAVNAELKKAIEAVNAADTADKVDDALGKGVTDIKNQHKTGDPVEARRGLHNKSIDEVAQATKDAITADTTLTEAEKETQRGNVDKEATKAKEELAKAKDADALDKAYGDGVTSIKNQHKSGKGLDVRKDEHKKALEAVAKRVTAEIEADPTLTPEVREQQKAEVQKELELATDKIAEAKDADEADKAYGDGVTAIENAHVIGKGIEARKDLAKKDLAEAVAKTKALIIEDKTLTDDQRKEQLSGVDTEYAKGIENIDAAKDAAGVDKAYSDGVRDILAQYKEGQNLDDRRNAAKEFLLKEADKVTKLINDDPTLTHDQKVDQINKVEQAKLDAIKSVDDAQTADAINDALGKGIENINNQYQHGDGVDVRKATAKGDLEKEAAKVKALIAKDPTLTQADKDKQTAAVDAAKNTAIAAVDKATTADGVNQELGKGITAINKAYRPGEGVKARKEAAKADLEKEAAKVKALIAKDPTLTQADKDKQTAAVDAAKNTAIAAVDKATTAEGINQELGKGITAINKAYRPGEGVKARKEAAKADLEKEAAKVKALITNDPTLTKADKAKQTGAVAKALKAAIAAVDKATTAEGINQELGKGITAINKAYRPGEGVKARKEAAKADLEREAAKVREAIANDPTLTKADKAKQTEAVAKALKAAIAAVDKATTAEGINQELGKGITAINKAYRPGEGVKARKEAAKANLEKVAKETKALISGDRYLSETEKAAQKQAVEQALAKALGQVEAAKTVEAVKLAENLGTVAIRSAYVAGLAKDTDQATAALNEAKQAAIEALKQAAAETLAKITTDAKLTEAQKAEQSENVSLALKTAIATVRSAQSIASVKEAKDKGITAIRAAYVPNKAVAKSSSANHLPKSGDANSIVLVGLGVMSLLLGMVLYSKKKESKD